MHLMLWALYHGCRVMPLVMAALRARTCSAATRHWCAETAATLAAPGGLSRLAEAGACEATLAAMASDLHSAGVQVCFITALEWLAQCASADRLAAAGVWQALAAAMRTHASHAVVQRSGTSCVGILCISIGTAGTAAAHAAGESEAVVDAAAAAASAREARRGAAAAGMPEILLAALQRHPQDARVCHHCLATLSLLAEAQEIAAKLGAAGACRQVVSVMHDHSDNSNVQAECAVLVYGLAWHSVANRVRCVEAGACASLVAAMLRFAAGGPRDDVAYVQERCAIALGILVAGSEAAAEAAINMGACAALAAALRMLEHAPKLLIESAAAVATLAAAWPGSAPSWLHGGGVCDALGVAMRHELCDVDALIECAAAATALAGSDKRGACAAALAAAGVCEAITAAMRTHGASAAVQGECAAAVSALAAHDAQCQERLGAAGAGEALLTALHTHIDRAFLVEECALAVGRLAEGNAVNARKLEGAGALDALILAMTRYGGSADVSAEVMAAGEVIAAAMRLGQGR
jgi:hypothetical protein